MSCGIRDVTLAQRVNQSPRDHGHQAMFMNLSPPVLPLFAGSKGIRLMSADTASAMLQSTKDRAPYD